jgi:hypothetical protein
MLVHQVICSWNSSSSGTAPRKKDMGWIWKVVKDPIKSAHHVVGTDMVYDTAAAIIRNIGRITDVNILRADG